MEKRIFEEVKKNMDTFALEFDDMLTGLRYFSWSVQTMQEKWWDSEKKCRDEVGIKPKHGLKQTSGNVCLICYEETDQSDFADMHCGHSFCKTCWKFYLDAKLKDGPVGIEATCPMEGCPLKVTHTMWTYYPSNIKLYTKYLCKSFTESNQSVKWCPKPGCEFAVETTNLAR